MSASGWRVGQGIDVHAFTDDPGRRLVLGGVTIPDAPGLAGHSDADVVLHALVDALLGAAGLGDLGGLVGIDDPRYAGADSGGFVRDAVARVRQDGWELVNLDCTIVAARPRIGPHRAVMEASVAGLLRVGAERVNLKATTTDALGSVGRGEGIACLAIVLLGPAAPVA